MEKRKVSGLPEWVPEIWYTVEASLIKAELDEMSLPIKGGDVVVLPWGEKYSPKKDYRTIQICDYSFYEWEKWEKKENKWVYIENDATSEKVMGGVITKKWEVRYIIYPPFPKVPPLRKAEWNGWVITGEIWDKKRVTFRKGRWSVEIPIFFRELETEKELEILIKKEIFFHDNEGDIADGTSLSHYGYFFERITYLSKILGVPDPGPGIKERIKKEKEKKEKEREEEEKKDKEEVEVTYSFLRLNNWIKFAIKDGKLFRLYGDNLVLLEGVRPPEKEVKIKMTRIEAKNPPSHHRIDLGGGYFAIYALNTEHKQEKYSQFSTWYTIKCTCGESFLESHWNDVLRKFLEHKKAADEYKKIVKAAFKE